MTAEAIPFFDPVRVLAPHRDALHAALQRCLDHGTFILGPEVSAFEAALATATGADAAIGVSSGTDALLAVFLALQQPDAVPQGSGLAPLRGGDEVLTTPFSFISTATSVLRAGLRPVFADLAQDQFHPDAAAFEAAWTPRTRAVLVVHLFGEPLDVRAIRQLCADRGAVLIEDCAQAMGARDASGVHVGNSGAAGCLSFFPAKNLGTLGDGGAVITRDAELGQRVRALRQHGQAQRYRFDSLGGNFRLDALHAALLGVLLPQLDGWLVERRQRAERYLQAWAPLQQHGVQLPQAQPGHSWNQFVVRLGDRDGVQRRLAALGIPTQIYYPSALHQQGALRAAHPPACLPRAEAACREVLALPIAPGLRADEEQRVIEGLIAAVQASPARS
jgi:dTDP-4-amino-4,6-dideoxygalactose transaminase